MSLGRREQPAAAAGQPAAAAAAPAPPAAAPAHAPGTHAVPAGAHYGKRTNDWLDWLVTELYFNPVSSQRQESLSIVFEYGWCQSYTTKVARPKNIKAVQEFIFSRTY